MPTIFSYKAAARVTWEELTLPDGDFIDIVWAGKSHDKTVILLHGLEGSIDSYYIQLMMDKLVAEGAQVVVMHYRGCGGRINRLPKAYHGGDTLDFAYLVRLLRQRFAHHKIYAVGFSLGGNILLHYLADDAKAPIDRAVVVSTAYEMNRSADFLLPMYQHSLLATMIDKVAEKIKLGYRMPVTLEQLKPIKTIRHFDALITAPLFHFRSVEEYYQACSCRTVLHKIQHPTLIIHAKDDPFVPVDSIPRENELSNQITFELNEKGGHLGFITGGWFWAPESYLPDRIVNFLFKHQKS